MSSYVKVNVVKPGSNKGAGGDKKDTIILFDWDDVLTYPSRDDKGIVITDNIVFKPNAYMIQVYATLDKIKSGSASSGELDAEGFEQTLEFTHPGSELEIREFKSNWLSRNIGAIVLHCHSTRKDQFGTPCEPMRMVAKWEDDKDKNISTITLKSSNKGPCDVADYQGTTVFDTVKGTVAADATTVDVAAGEGQYQLTTGTASAETLTTLSNPVNGGIYSLLGSGGAHPSQITAANDFVLSSGTTWTALSGAQITFKAFKNGVSTWKFFEQSRG